MNDFNSLNELDIIMNQSFIFKTRKKKKVLAYF